MCSFCAGRFNPQLRHSIVARTNGFHSNTVQSQDFGGDPFALDDGASEAQRALQQAKRRREEQEAARVRQQEDLADRAHSRKLFGNKTQGKQRLPQRQQNQQRQHGHQSQPRQQAHQTQQSGQSFRITREPVDPAANRPLNRVQTAQREVRNKSERLHRTQMQDRINARITSTDSMPSLDSLELKPRPTPTNSSSQQPSARPQFRAEPKPQPKPAVNRPTWMSSFPTPRQGSAATSDVQAPAQETQEPQDHEDMSSQPPQPSNDFEDIFGNDLDQSRQAFADQAVVQTRQPEPQPSAHMADEPKSTRDMAFEKWQKHQDQRRQRQDQDQQRYQQPSQEQPQPSKFTELASSYINPRPRIVMESNQPGSPSSVSQGQSDSAGSPESLSAEEERMLQALLARKNKLSANPSTSSMESLFEEQNQETRSALVAETKQRVQQEQAKQEEQERRLQQNRGPRFSTVMVNSRGQPDEAPYDPEVAKNWDILKPRQQQSRHQDEQRRPQQQQQWENGSGKSARYAPMSADGIDEKFEEYRRQRPRYGMFNIESLNVEDRPSGRSDRRRPEQTCVRCGQPGHFFANCPNPPKAGWVDRTRRSDRNGERGERQQREPRNAGREMAAATAPKALEGIAEAETIDPTEDEAARRILERNARRASRFVEEDEESEGLKSAPTKGRRSRFEEEEDDDDDDKPRRSRRGRFGQDDDAEADFGAFRDGRAERKKARQAKKDKAAKEAARQAARQARRAEAMTPINLPEFVSVSKLAQLTNLRYEDLSEKMEELGFENTAHDHVLSAEEAGLIAMEHNFDPTLGAAEEAEAEERDLKPLPEPAPEDKEFLPVRPPVVAIMGHVDHGKTTILDYLRKSSIAATEHGGITQHIGAFSVALSSGKTITFLDTPGHAAFLEMRKRGATVTDIIILVVAADDSVKPQTIEAIRHAKAANVPIIVAVNKIDKEEANVERVKGDLARHEVEIEDFGGDTQVIPVSGKTGQGIDELEDAAVTLSEVLDHRADTEGSVEGWVLEATTKKAGRVATVLVRRGTLKPGSIIVAGKTWARVRSLRNEAGITQLSAGPGTPIEVDGWRDQPNAGDEVLQAPNEQKAADVIDFRNEKEERLRMADDMEKINTQRRDQQEKRDAAKEAAAAERAARADGTEGTETDASATRKQGANSEGESDAPTHQTVPFIIKADVSGSVEAVSAYLLQMTNAQCSPTVLRASVGPVTEFDIEHADAAGGHIISFNLPSDPDSAGRAERKGIRILEQNVIYRIVDDVRAVLEEKLPPLKTQKVTGEAEVAVAFEIGVGGRKKVRIAGLKVRNGVVARGSRVRVQRGDVRVYDGEFCFSPSFPLSGEICY